MCRLILAFSLLTANLLTAAPDAATDGHTIDMVRRKLANDPEVKGGALDVDVKDGVTTLRGKVAREKDKARAEKLTKKVKGVKSVVNQLEVSPLRP